LDILKTRIPPPLYGIGTATLMWWVDRVLPISRVIDAPWNRLGWVLVTIGFAIDAYSAAVFFKAKTTVNPMRVTGAMYLVTSGLYRWSRNPMYCGLIIGLIGWGVVLGSLAPLVAIVLFQRILVIVQIKPEELALEANFGDAYRDYTRRVNRWIGWNRP
jgi:protein-S-isoprenylcysteine O-methyltransferase Ste14